MGSVTWRLFIPLGFDSNGSSRNKSVEQIDLESRMLRRLGEALGDM